MVILNCIIIVYQNGVLIDLKTIFLLSYGCNLDHNNIDFLVKERLMPFTKYKGNKPNKTIPRTPEILLIYDVYDVNRNKHVDNKYYLEEFFISETRLQAFEYSLSKLKGHHMQCRPYARGHYNVFIDGKEYSSRVYQTLSSDNELFFLDEETFHNIGLREKSHNLPSELQWLTLPQKLDPADRGSAISNWIQKIINWQ